MAPMDVDQTMSHYAAEIQKIVDNGIIGDYTWKGLLFQFWLDMQRAEERGEQADADPRPHSRACNVDVHAHGPLCHSNCPTCHTRTSTEDPRW